MAPSYPALTDLFHQLDARLPHGDYRIPSLVTTVNGTLLAFVAGRFHRTDITPNILFMRRSEDDGRTWLPAQAVLRDPHNKTEFGGAPIVDRKTGVVHYVFGATVFGGERCSGCTLRLTSSGDDGRTWSPPRPLTVRGPVNATYGSALASGIALTRGPHAGRLLLALRHDCGCGLKRTSFVVYSDDQGQTWTGGAEMMLLPKFGGGWTECQVAELHNGSVLMTSRNYYSRTSGQGPRLFARSDDGGKTWAANWSASAALPDPYCEASLLADPERGALYFGNPSSHRRENFSLHVSKDGGRTWPSGRVLYPAGAAYSDLSWTRNGSLAFLFERDNYNTVAFGTVEVR